MRAVEMTGYGGPDMMRVNNAAQRPAAPGPGEVLVRVAAAGINPVDWKIREGYMKDFVPFVFPAILGNELAGTIEAVGSDVTGLAVGDEVHGATGLAGAFAEYVVLKAELTVKKPKNLSMAQAAAVPVAAATSVVALNTGEVGKGTRILIHAAAGGVGSVALQLARLRGAEVTALASPGNMEFVKELGAAHVVDRTGDYENKLGEFDVVLDAYGPEAQARSWKLLRRGGILISLAAPPPEDVAAAHGVRAAMIHGVPSKAAFNEVDKFIGAGELKIFVSRTYPVEQAKAAMAECEAGQVRGKLVLIF
jgi:NADPH:quinone reductase-like Zn-dependent oxidoreductase